MLDKKIPILHDKFIGIVFASKSYTNAPYPQLDAI